MGNSGDARCAGGNCNAPVDARATAGGSRYFRPEAQAMQEKRLDKDIADGRQNWAESGYAARVPPPPPAAPAPPPAAFAPAPRSPVVAGLLDEKDTGDADIAVTGARISKSSNDDLSSADIVVTGQMRSAARRAGRGDWNACTVNDPNQSLSACKKLVDPAASGPAGRAASHIADGLSLAWQDDLDGAIAAFDRAIAVSPRLSFAYLNRGQAYLREGELTRALADLDQAVRYAPSSARNYYSRSLVRRQSGDTRRAEADEARAIDLDERYEVLFR
jgi:tetratricopeptide (TPR) repeat protein